MPPPPASREPQLYLHLRSPSPPLPPRRQSHPPAWYSPAPSPAPYRPPRRRADGKKTSAVMERKVEWWEIREAGGGRGGSGGDEVDRTGVGRDARLVRVARCGCGEKAKTGLGIEYEGKGDERAKPLSSTINEISDVQGPAWPESPGLGLAWVGSGF
ncbi:hypothetical protein C8R45DRAFT_927629 [Mycena sanguinolenta]|nr:hypothetical protein C8R45DRAFT_927629 [Mycena sanguinolenta]